MGDYTVRQIAGGFHFLEGPRWHNGRLYFSDFADGKVFVLEPDGRVEVVCQAPNWVSGLGFTPRDELLVVAVQERKLLRCSPAEGLVEVADLSGVARYHCNDMLVDECGRAYIGNFGFDMDLDRIRAADLAMVSPRGEVSIVARDLIFPNGMARTADGRTLIVAETFAARLTAFDILADGTLTARRTWAALSDREFTTVSECLGSGDPLPDGIALDGEGALWIADAGGRSALRIAPGGEILDRVPTPDLSVFAVALGGPDLKTLYLCASPPLYSSDPRVEKKAVLLATRVDVPGVPVV
ncbi:MAG TPA: SMP-30/gluconolactonase/LRE family protein [Steroidobacteraceae bacterium]|nr:SMP-30/gluconolactonase/LRE family protein [Steroidobacteraceae bacterium]